MVLIFDLDDTLFDSTHQPLETATGWPLKIFDEWLKVLGSKDYTHILVTRGSVGRQNKKIDALGIREYFSDIYIVDNDEEKQKQFLLIKNKFLDAKIMVIGNRIDAEIRYGNMLGLKTILVRHGKHKDRVAKDALEIPVGVIDPHSAVGLHKQFEIITKVLE